VSGPAIQVESIGWERPQFVVRLRTAGSIDGDGFCLVRADRPKVAMPATGWRHDRRVLEVRFNVVVGPGIRPLDAARWLLCRSAGGRAGTQPVVLTEPLDLAAHARAFAIPQGVYRATPVIEPSTGGLALDIELDMPGGRISAIGAALARRGIRPRSLGFGLVFAIMKAVARRSGRRILFVSGSRTAPAGNLRIVHDRLVERGLDRDYEIRILLRWRGRDPTWRERFAMGWAIARADVILVQGSRMEIVYLVDLDPDVRLIQLWHASGAFKTVRYSRLGKPGGPDPWSRIHRNYTHAIVSSEQDVRFYAEGFGILEAQVIPTGIPQMDRFFDDDARAAAVGAAEAAFPEIAGRMTILFAPTYRDSTSPKDGEYPIELLDYAALHALCVERDAVVIIKMHPFARTDLHIPERFRDRLLDGYRKRIDVNDLLFAVDLLITDYSSIVFEYSTLGRPMLFFAYDLEDYVATRDFYVPFESFVPGRIVRTFPEMLDAIRNDDYQAEKVADFASRHFAHHDSGSTDRVIDQLILAR
jgi:CDP-ribitol ribitolphosphotransferase / teichoic acid ribitol-phosphate polymerase